MASTINLTKSNRAIGLMNELADLTAAEDSSLELTRIRATLRSLSDEARHPSEVVERNTKQIARASRAQTIARKPASARIASLMARC